MNCRKILKKFLANFKKNRAIFASLLLFLFLIFIPGFSLLTGGNGIVQCSGIGCSWSDFVRSLSNLLKEIVVVSFWLAVLFSVIGSFMMMLSGPKPDNYQTGKSIILTAIYSYILILLGGIIFDVILDFFQPQFKTYFLINFSFAASLEPKVYFNPLKNMLSQGLRCGRNATSPLSKIFLCISEATSALTSLAVVLLGVAIFMSAVYLISTPFFGLANISKAWQIFIWSIIGLIIILLAELIKDQIMKLVTFDNIFLNFAFAQAQQPTIEPGRVEFSWESTTVKVCPPSIFGSGACEYPSVKDIASNVVTFIVNRLAPPILVLLIIIGGFFYLLSPFDVKNIQTAHNYIKWAVYGYFILLIITAILSVVSVFLGGPAATP